MPRRDKLLAVAGIAGICCFFRPPSLPASGGEVVGFRSASADTIAPVNETSPPDLVTLAGLTDEEAERILMEGEIRIVTDMTRTGWPRKLLWVEYGDRTLGAVFNDHDYRPPGGIRHYSYRYERAAYLLDRLLGINMAPVVVLRQLNGTKGSLAAYVAAAVNEKERSKRGMVIEDKLHLRRQVAKMRLFDALIGNARAPENILFTPHDERLHLISNYRGFSSEGRLPRAFLRRPSFIAPDILQRLENLEDKNLDTRLEGLVTKPRVKALMKRRDKILQKIEQDRRRLGDAAVFYEDEP